MALARLCNVLDAPSHRGDDTICVANKRQQYNQGIATKQPQSGVVVGFRFCLCIHKLRPQPPRREHDSSSQQLSRSHFHRHGGSHRQHSVPRLPPWQHLATVEAGNEALRDSPYPHVSPTPPSAMLSLSVPFKTDLDSTFHSDRHQPNSVGSLHRPQLELYTSRPVDTTRPACLPRPVSSPWPTCVGLLYHQHLRRRPSPPVLLYGRDVHRRIPNSYVPAYNQRLRRTQHRPRRR